MTLWFSLLLVLFVGLFVKGFRKRRGTWSARSWRRFALMFLLSLLPALGGLMLAFRVDRGLQFGETIATRELSVLAMIAIATFAFCVPVYVLGWFATGESDRQVDWPLISSGHSPNTR